LSQSAHERQERGASAAAGEGVGDRLASVAAGARARRCRREAPTTSLVLATKLGSRVGLCSLSVVFNRSTAQCSAGTGSRTGKAGDRGRSTRRSTRRSGSNCWRTTERPRRTSRIRRHVGRAECSVLARRGRVSARVDDGSTHTAHSRQIEPTKWAIPRGRSTRTPAGVEQPKRPVSPILWLHRCGRFALGARTHRQGPVSPAQRVAVRGLARRARCPCPCPAGSARPPRDRERQDRREHEREQPQAHARRPRTPPRPADCRPRLSAGRPKCPGRPGRPYTLRRGSSRRGDASLRSLFRELNAPPPAPVHLRVHRCRGSPHRRTRAKPSETPRTSRRASQKRPAPVAFTPPSGVSASLIRDPVTFNGSMPSECHRSMPPLLLPDMATPELTMRGSSRCGCKSSGTWQDSRCWLNDAAR
jgi:hypothetical protein